MDVTISSISLFSKQKERRRKIRRERKVGIPTYTYLHVHSYIYLHTINIPTSLGYLTSTYKFIQVVKSTYCNLQCDQISPNFATLVKFKLSLAIIEDLFTIWRNFKPTLVQIYYIGTNFHPCKWLNIEK